MASIVELNLHVASTGSQKSRIKFFSVIGCHEQNSSFLGSDTIKCIKESRKCYSSAGSLISSAINIVSLNEDSIDIFKKNDTFRRGVIQSSIEAIITKSVTTQV